MDTNKSRARKLAVIWWKSSQSEGARAQGYAVCDRCAQIMPLGVGYLCEPKRTFFFDGSVFATPDLICENCFDLDLPEAWNQNKRRPETLDEFARMKPRKKWWQFWR